MISMIRFNYIYISNNWTFYIHLIKLIACYKIRYQKEFEYISETIEKLNVTITNQSEALFILAEGDFYNDSSKDLRLLGHKCSHF